jgi:AcrR family transcriptional regulator
VARSPAPKRRRTLSTKAQPAARTAPRGRGRPPGKTSEQTRSRIVLAARGCFARVGYERATNQEIAASAGVSATAIYLYFESKPALYFAVVRDAAAELVPHLRALIATSSTMRGAIQAVVRMSTSVDTRHASAGRFMLGIPIEMQRHPEVSQGMLSDPGEIFAIITELVDKGVRAEEIDPDKTQRVISMLIAVLMGLGSYASILGAPYAESAVEGFVDLLEGKLFKTTSKRRG